VDPKKVRMNPLPPKVIIEKLLVNDHLLTEHPLPDSPLRIAPGRHRYEFQFTGLSFTAPEKVRFRYRLEKLENEWVETQSPRRAYYSHIPPGSYVFRVIACNNDGLWNDSGASLAFTVLPAFWQTWSFRIFGGIMTAVVGGGIVWLDARRRTQRKVQRLERQQAIERERARIARDIHDDLGAGLTRISLLSESVPLEQINPPQAGEALDRIFSTTHEITQAMDEIVWAINPQHDTLDSLVTYLGKFAQDFMESAGVRCRLDMPMQLPGWRLDAEVRHSLFLACKESLNNVLRHATATEVRVSVMTESNSFRVIIEDNGKGFETCAAMAASASSRQPAGRNGLVNMHRRLQQIGGQCEITSVIGQGTKVQFVVTVNPEKRKG
jgi:signal transduction histidine kinase